MDWIKPGLRNVRINFGENVMCRYSRLSLQGPKDVDSTKSGTSEAHMSPCKHSGLESWAGQTTKRNKHRVDISSICEQGWEKMGQERRVLRVFFFF